jgi:hypothetical protein
MHYFGAIPGDPAELLGNSGTFTPAQQLSLFAPPAPTLHCQVRNTSTPLGKDSSYAPTCRYHRTDRRKTTWNTTS